MLMVMGCKKNGTATQDNNNLPGPGNRITMITMNPGTTLNILQ
jgi:hypothetical protein